VSRRRRCDRTHSRLVIAGAAAFLVISACADAPLAPEWSDPDASEMPWGTWVLSNAWELRPESPAADREEELNDVRRLQRERSDADDELIRRWDRPPTGPWTELAMDLVDRYIMTLPRNRVATPARASRTAALVHVAMYDALVAAWDAKHHHGLEAPYRADPAIERFAAESGGLSYPSGHAAASAAAAEILAYAFPTEDPTDFRTMAEEAGRARVLAGVSYPSDVAAGLEIGRQVAELVLARAGSDGAELRWDGEFPEGDHVWRPTPPRMTSPPYDPRAGEWRPWVLTSSDQFRPAPPPAIGSADFRRDMDELRDMPEKVTAEQAEDALYWATSAPSMRWHLYMEEALLARDVPPLHAARAHALTSVAMYDAFVACWEAKYHYWLLRPVSVDPELETLFPTPPFPAYPSGHSTISAAAAEVFAHLFPDAASEYRARAETAAESRVWGGVHYRFDSNAGKDQGSQIGRVVVEHGRKMISSR